MYPPTVYRVVVKALVADEDGKILVVKEKQDSWSLPGGGLEHGESPKECLEREIKEEIGTMEVTVGEIAYSTSAHLDQKDIWMTWIVYKAKIGSSDFKLGEGVTDATFIDIADISNSSDLFEKLIVETVQAVKVSV